MYKLSRLQYSEHFHEPLLTNRMPPLTQDKFEFGPEGQEQESYVLIEWKFSTKNILREDGIIFTQHILLK